MTLRDVRSGLADYQAWATDPRPRIGLGLDFFDKYTNGGLAKAECAMILAYSSVGKTSIALNMIANNPMVPTVFFSLEMSWRQVVARETGITSGIPTWELEQLLKAGEVPPSIIQTGINYPFLLGDDASEMSIKDMKAGVMEASQKLGQQIRLVVIDYLELIGGAGMLGKAEQVDKAAQKIRALAKDCDTSVVVLHQVAKGDGSGGHEALSLDSGKFGGHHPMDYVIGAYAPRLDRKLTKQQQAEMEGEIYLQLLKNRNGKARPEGIRHYLDPMSGRLCEWGKQHQQALSVPAFQPTLQQQTPVPDWVAGLGRPQVEDDSF